MNIRLVRFDRLDSTNTEAARQPREGADEGLSIVADEQTAGRGRMGREWTSNAGTGAYFSVLLRPQFDTKFISLIPLAAAVAIHDVLLKGFLIQPDIKWPNDILVGDKKICGILSEAADTKQGLAVIVGIGINLTTPDGQENATSIAAESQYPCGRDDIVRAVAADLGGHYETLKKHPHAVIELWRERSSYFEGKEVTVTESSEVFTGTTAGLEANGALRVKLSDGSIKVVQAGDVERLRST